MPGGRHARQLRADLGPQGPGSLLRADRGVDSRAMDAAPKRSRRALAWVATTNFGEGLPWSVLHQMGTELITDRGGTPTQIASTSLFHLAVTFKFLWSPIVDLFGSKRGWVLATQLVLGGGMMAIAAATAAPGFALF